jgi:antirestriction protein ArdC
MRPEIRTGESKAYYVPLYDYINMPRTNLFHGDAEYYSTLFHELGHYAGTRIMPRQYSRHCYSPV